MNCLPLPVFTVCVIKMQECMNWNETKMCITTIKTVKTRWLWEMYIYLKSISIHELNDSCELSILMLELWQKSGKIEKNYIILIKWLISLID